MHKGLRRGPIERRGVYARGRSAWSSTPLSTLGNVRAVDHAEQACQRKLVRALEAVGLEERRSVERLVVGTDLDLVHLAEGTGELIHRVTALALAHAGPRPREDLPLDLAHDEPLAELRVPELTMPG